MLHLLNKRIPHVLLGFGLVFCTLALTGCGSDPNKKVNVHGTVSYKGSAVGSGWVKFYNQKKEQVGSAMLKADGQFTATDMPKEKVIATVESSVSAGMMPGKAPPGTPVIGGETGKGVDIPRKYTNPETSPLNYEITAAEQKLEIKLD